jgi:hypothetical protein
MSGCGGLRCIALFGCDFCILRSLSPLYRILQHGTTVCTYCRTKSFRSCRSLPINQTIVPIIYEHWQSTSFGYSQCVYQMPFVIVLFACNPLGLANSRAWDKSAFPIHEHGTAALAYLRALDSSMAKHPNADAASSGVGVSEDERSC